MKKNSAIIIPLLRKKILFALLILSYLLFSYYYFGKWWNSSVGSVLILFFSHLIWKKDFLKHIGLQLDFKTVIKSILLAGLITICAFLIMKYIAGRNDIQIRFTSWRDYYHDIFYILNEEIVLGAILLFYLINKGKIRPVTASIGLAVFFALIHFVFYRWIFDNRGLIGISTMTSLFLVGFVRNSLIFQTGHIGYSWALHFGWMAVMFGSIHVDMDTGTNLTELRRFNLYLGSGEMLVISIIVAGLSILYWIKKYRSEKEAQAG